MIEIQADMIIVVDSGATKTAWRSVAEDGTLRSVQTGGMSPTCLDAGHFQSLVREAVPQLNPDGRTVEAVYFYGAGLVSEETCAPIRTALEMWCPFARVEFHSDLMAAARALFGGGSGVVAIMGTGSNSCLYSQGAIAGHINAGGFIIGDEGSASALGKALISDYIKELLPEGVRALFDEKFALSYQKVVHQVYKEPGAASFLGSFAPFVLENIDEPSGYMHSLLDDCLDSFMKRALSRYHDADGPVKRVGVVGSFGCACEDHVRKIGERYGLEFVKFLKSPIDELVKYHGI